MIQRFEQLLAESPGDERDKGVIAERFARALGTYYRWGAAAPPARFLPHQVGRDALADLLPAGTEVVTVDTACSSSLFSIDLGVKGLNMGDFDIAVCGGAMSLAPLNGVLFSKFRGLSPTGVCRPLDRDCDGVLFADGAGVVVLKRVSQAIADGDPILAVIKAFGSSSDGNGKAIYAPKAAGQKIALKRARSHPGYGGDQVNWIIAHATGTPSGDAAELAALRESFPSATDLYVSSNKAIIGHTGWAAGVASVIEGVLGIQKGVIPPQHRVREPHPELAQQPGFKIPTQPQRLGDDSPASRRVAVSSFGFGGINGHMLLTGFDPKAPSAPVPERAYDARVAIVAWAARLPGLTSRDAVRDWLHGHGAGPAASFGPTYPPPAIRAGPHVGPHHALDRSHAAHDSRMRARLAHLARRVLGDASRNGRRVPGPHGKNCRRHLVCAALLPGRRRSRS